MPLQPVLGQIMPFAGNIVPRGWAICNGSLLAIQTNQALFSLLGTYYGGDGIRTFGLPDLRGRAIIGSDNGGQFPPGMVSGNPSVTLDTTQIPPHNHIIQAATATVTGRGAVAPTGKIFATNSLPATSPTLIFVTAGSGETPLASGTNVMNDGGSLAHNNMQPYLTINYLIAMQGVFPSRN
jgi:microcystin-dependent protein